MITYVASDGSVALISSIAEGEWTVAVYDSFGSVRDSSPRSTLRFTGSPNQSDMQREFPGWAVVCRDDATWAISDTGEQLPELPPVPPRVSARQIRLYLIRRGIALAAVDAAIDAIADPQQRDEVRVEWDYAPYIERAHPMLVPLALSLGLTSEQVDEAFREAATI